MSSECRMPKLFRYSSAVSSVCLSVALACIQFINGGSELGDSGSCLFAR